jgi:hypothetical protein
MRKLLSLLALAAVAGFGCQPKILLFTAQPSSVAAGPAKVKLHWKFSLHKGYLSSDKPVTPALVPPKPVGTEGTIEVDVCETTTFKLEAYYGGEQTITVPVSQKCGAGGCSPQVLTFTGQCDSPNMGPTYVTQTVSASVVSGDLANLFSDADLPVHVLHEGQTIALGANGSPIGALPVVPAAGQYTISIPGAVGEQICKDAFDPLGGGSADAPVVHLTVVPACPKP